MALVRGRDPIVGIEIKLEDDVAAWGSAGVHPASWVGVPLLREDLNIERAPLAETEEITPLGAREALETGRLIAVGSITVRPRWDSKWFNMFLGNLGYEQVFGGIWVDGGGTALSSTQSHVYALNNTIPAGFNIRVNKSGNTAGKVRELFVGALVSKMTWTQPQDNHAEVTFEFLAKSLTLEAAGSSSAAPDGSAICELRDLSRTGTYASAIKIRPNLATKSGWVALTQMRTFTVTVDRSMAFQDSPLDDIDTVEKPGVSGQREITVELVGSYEETDPTSNVHPYNNFVANKNSGFMARYVSSTMITGSIPYACQLCVPRMVFTEGAVPIDSGDVLEWRATATSIVGPVGDYPAADSDTADDFAEPPAPGTDFKIATSVNTADDNGIGDGNVQFTESPDFPA